MDSEPHKPKRDLQPLLTQFVESENLSEAEGFADLYDATLKLAGILLANRPKQPGETAEDLAMDFLLNWVRVNRITEIQSLSGLNRELKKYFMSRNNPERKDLWDVLSAAVRKLARSGKARRIDTDLKEDNSNKALWSSAPPERDDAPLNMDSFRADAEKLPFYRRQREEGRPITPTDAEKLILGLLDAAGCPIKFETLVDEAQHHVDLHMQTPVPTDDEETSNDLEILEDQASWIIEEAPDRAERIWSRVQEGSGEKVLCLYFLPKHYLKNPVVLADLGPSSTIQPQSSAVNDIMREELKVERLSEDRTDEGAKRFSNAWKMLTKSVVRILMKKCTEKGLDGNFHKSEQEES